MGYTNTGSNVQFLASEGLNEYFSELQKECFDNLDNGGNGAGNKLVNTAKAFGVFKIAVTPADLECFNTTWRGDTSDVRQ